MLVASNKKDTGNKMGVNEKMKEKIGWIRKVLLFTLITTIAICLQPMETKAQLCDIAYLQVAGKVMVEDGEVKLAKIEDGKGGIATYDEGSNTLTLDNFHYIEGCGAKYYIYGYSMSVNEELNVVLNGINDLRRRDRIPEGTDTRENAAMYLMDTVCIKGMGKLLTNTKVTIGKGEIRDCTMEIQGVYYGMYVPDGLSIHNADVTIGIDSFCNRSAALYLDGGKNFKLKIQS